MNEQEFSFFQPEMLFLYAVIAGAIVLFIQARRRQAPVNLAIIGAWHLLTGFLMLGFISAHLAAVLWRAFTGKGVGGEEVFTYNFRFYSLILMGVIIVIPALLCFGSAWRLTKADRASWKRSWWSSLVLLGVNAPLAPIQGFAVGFTIFSVINLVTLALTRKYFPPNSVNEK